MDIHTLLYLKSLYFLQSLDYEYSNALQRAPALHSFLHFDKAQLEQAINQCQLCAKSSEPAVGLCHEDSKVIFLSLHPLLDSHNRFGSKSAQMLHAIITKVFGFQIHEVSIFSLLKCDIMHSQIQQSVQSCQAFLLKALELASAKYIIVLGQEAYQHLCADTTDYTLIQGRIIQWDKYFLFPTFSLKELLQKPKLKSQAHQELLTIKSYL